MSAKRDELKIIWIRDGQLCAALAIVVQKEGWMRSCGYRREGGPKEMAMKDFLGMNLWLGMIGYWEVDRSVPRSRAPLRRR